jgi:cell division septum initiation protein DivIVA
MHKINIIPTRSLWFWKNFTHNVAFTWIHPDTVAENLEGVKCWAQKQDGEGATGSQRGVSLCSTDTSAAFDEQIKKAKAWLNQGRTSHHGLEMFEVKPNRDRRGLREYSENGGTNSTENSFNMFESSVQATKMTLSRVGNVMHEVASRTNQDRKRDSKGPNHYDPGHYHGFAVEQSNRLALEVGDTAEQGMHVSAPPHNGELMYDEYYKQQHPSEFPNFVPVFEQQDEQLTLERERLQREQTQRRIQLRNQQHQQLQQLQQLQLQLQLQGHKPPPLPSSSPSSSSSPAMPAPGPPAPPPSALLASASPAMASKAPVTRPFGSSDPEDAVTQYWGISAAELERIMGMNLDGQSKKVLALCKCRQITGSKTKTRHLGGTSPFTVTCERVRVREIQKAVRIARTQRPAKKARLFGRGPSFS